MACLARVDFGRTIQQEPRRREPTSGDGSSVKFEGASVLICRMRRDQAGSGGMKWDGGLGRTNADARRGYSDIQQDKPIRRGILFDFHAQSELLFKQCLESAGSWGRTRASGDTRAYRPLWNIYVWRHGPSCPLHCFANCVGNILVPFVTGDSHASNFVWPQIIRPLVNI